MPSAPALSPHSSRGRAQAERATTSAWCREAALPPSPAPSPTGGQWGHTCAGRQRAFPTWSPLIRLCTSPRGEGPGVISPGPLPSAKMRPVAGWGVGGLTHPTAPPTAASSLIPPPFPHPRSDPVYPSALLVCSLGLTPSSRPGGGLSSLLCEEPGVQSLSGCLCCSLRLLEASGTTWQFPGVKPEAPAL